MTVVRHQQRELGNFPIDALFCEEASQNTSVVDSLSKWEKQIWDGTTDKGRECFPTDILQHRVVRYESCRGLEGWTVVCLGLDNFFNRKCKQWKQPEDKLLLQTPEAAAELAGATWCLIPFTRALDTLVIQVCHDGRFINVLFEIFNEHRDFIEWRNW